MAISTAHSTASIVTINQPPTTPVGGFDLQKNSPLAAPDLDKSLTNLKATAEEAHSNTIDLNTRLVSIEGGGSSSGEVKVTSNDTTKSYLNNKLTAGTNITLTVLNAGANESLQIVSDNTESYEITSDLDLSTILGKNIAIKADSSTSAINITLPSPSNNSNKGTSICVKRIGSNNVTLNGLIDGSNSKVLNNGDSILLTSSGSEWFSISGASGTSSTSSGSGSSELPAYSTSEVLTPKRWIDGKPIYKKTIEFGQLSGDTANPKLVAHNIVGYEHIWLDYEASYVKWGNQVYPLFWKNYRFWLSDLTGSNADYIYQSPEYNFDTSLSNAIVTLKYTKTSDTSSSPVTLIGSDKYNTFIISTNTTLTSDGFYIVDTPNITVTLYLSSNNRRTVIKNISDSYIIVERQGTNLINGIERILVFSKDSVTLVDDGNGNFYTLETIKRSNPYAIFGFGYTGAVTAVTNKVSNTGVVLDDTAGVTDATARCLLAAAGYGYDKAIFGFGTTDFNNAAANKNITNLVDNTGIVQSNQAAQTGTPRWGLAAAGYGYDKAIFGFGTTGSNTAVTNLVSNTGVVQNDTAGVGTAHRQLAAASYGYDKAIFGFGVTSAGTAITNLVSNIGAVFTDTAGIGTARYGTAAATYGYDKAIFGFGRVTNANTAVTNLVSNTGVVQNDTAGVGTLRHSPAAAGYGYDKAIFGFGYTSAVTAKTNLVSNTGVVSTDQLAQTGTPRYYLAAAGYGS